MRAENRPSVLIQINFDPRLTQAGRRHLDQLDADFVSTSNLETL
jgi:predicted SprT family Zn-dependent metalloprotease